MYNKIVNPKTNRSVSINSKLGKKIIRDYVRMIGGLGRWSPWAEEEHAEKRRAQEEAQRERDRVLGDWSDIWAAQR